MIGKEHNMLLRDIRRYEKQLGQSKIAQSDFFTESTYMNSQNKKMPCYQITKKGCEFIAHKLTGIKGTEFTARYINKFHEMEDIITGQQAQAQQEMLASAVLKASEMLKEKDEQIKRLETMKNRSGQVIYMNNEQIKREISILICNVSNTVFLRRIYISIDEYIKENQNS